MNLSNFTLFVLETQSLFRNNSGMSFGTASANSSGTTTLVESPLSSALRMPPYSAGSSLVRRCAC